MIVTVNLSSGAYEWWFWGREPKRWDIVIVGFGPLVLDGGGVGFVTVVAIVAMEAGEDCVRACVSVWTGTMSIGLLFTPSSSLPATNLLYAPPLVPGRVLPRSWQIDFRLFVVSFVGASAQRSCGRERALGMASRMMRFMLAMSIFG